MSLAAIDPSDVPAEIPVRGHPVRDWLWRLGRREAVGSSADPAERRRVESEEGLQIEVLLPGFRAAEVSLRGVADRIELEARHESGNREGSVARLALAVDDRYAPRLASADLAGGCLVIAVPPRPSNLVRIPVRPR